MAIISNDNITIIGNDNSVSATVRKRRVRRSPEVSRRFAIEAAQRLLIEKGPAGVTLQAVAKAIGMTHGNLTHHFGSSAALHTAMIAAMAERVAIEAAALVERMRKGELGSEAIVDLVFDALAKGGYGRLIGWLSASGQGELLAPILDSLSTSVAAYRVGEHENIDQDRFGAGPIVLGLISHALTASLLGGALEQAACMPAGSLRRLAARQLNALRAASPAPPDA